MTSYHLQINEEQRGILVDGLIELIEVIYSTNDSVEEAKDLLKIFRFVEHPVF